MNLVEQYRSLSVRHTLSQPTVAASWPNRRERLLASLPEHPTAEAIVELGDVLSDAFRCQGAGDRSQQSLSGGGVLWSALVAWYLNLCYAGTNAVALCGGSLVPKCIKDAVSVNYNNTSVGADMDVVVLAMPFLLATPSVVNTAACRRLIENNCAANFGSTGLTIIQCKTNWNDNAQVPMLWNLLYRQAYRGVIPENGYTFGRNGRNIRNLRYFSYAFVTVPTTQGGPDGFRVNSAPVLRVQGMTGGAYWGYPTRNGVCRSLKEFYNHHFGMAGNTMPNVADVGQAYCQTLTRRNDQCDVAAFDLYGD
jgi:hypothetical protein